MNKKINLILISIFIGASIGFVIEYNRPSPQEVNLNTTNTSNNNTKDIMFKEDNNYHLSINKEDYQKKIDNSNDLFMEVLSKYNIKTIINKQSKNDYNIVENSIFLEELNLPNGFKKVILDSINDKYTNLYISLINSLKNSTWNETLNIILDSNTKSLDFNELIFPEIIDLIENFAKDIDKNLFINDVNNLIQSKDKTLSKELYSISKEISNNNLFLQISIYTENGKINKK